MGARGTRPSDKNRLLRQSPLRRPRRVQRRNSPLNSSAFGPPAATRARTAQRTGPTREWPYARAIVTRVLAAGRSRRRDCRWHRVGRRCSGGRRHDGRGRCVRGRGYGCGRCCVRGRLHNWGRCCDGKGRGDGRRGFLGLLAADDFEFRLREIIGRIQEGIFKKLGQGNSPRVRKLRHQLLFLFLR